MSVPPAVPTSPSDPPTEPTPRRPPSSELRALVRKGRRLLDLDAGTGPDSLEPAIAVLLGQLDLDQLDAAATRDTCDQEAPAIDHDLIRLHVLTGQAIRAGVKSGMLHPDLTEILNCVADVLDSCRMYKTVNGQWVRDEWTVQMWREMRARHAAGLPLLPEAAIVTTGERGSQ